MLLNSDQIHPVYSTSPKAGRLWMVAIVFLKAVAQSYSAGRQTRGFSRDNDKENESSNKSNYVLH